MLRLTREMGRRGVGVILLPPSSRLVAVVGKSA